MLNAAPGHLGDVNHTVHTAQIHESAVAGQRLDRAGVLLTHLSLRPEGGLLLLAGGLS